MQTELEKKVYTLVYPHSTSIFSTIFNKVPFEISDVSLNVNYSPAVLILGPQCGLTDHMKKHTIEKYAD